MKRLQSSRCKEEHYVQVYTARYSHDLNHWNIRSEDLLRCLWLGTDALSQLSVSDVIFVQILSLCLGPESV